MAGNRIEYTLAFTADTAKARQQVNDLKSQIDRLISGAGTRFGDGLGITREIHEATSAAAQLKVQLSQATSATTGKLDLTQFNQSLQKSGMTLDRYKEQLMRLGPEGRKAFADLAIAITNSEQPLFKFSEGVKKLGESLANTIRWSISSTAINAVTSGISQAYTYAQNLNKSLNEIRIVSGASTAEMADFAKEANKAAKTLSSSTLAYTDAALIYYQQGLSDEEVKKRTDATIKMSNVTGESAANVSSYMTAIWNNFDDGSKSLEYYADVITALGAETAASSEEIANGLEKFAAIGDTVGLSYEYATAALTTIIDKTRQSEDVVGNALRTIFSRIQGLQLGETQEDGVTLNKYSEALQKVGISILDSNGELKQMDSILDEMGKKWETLGQAEKVALAETVGGARQYSQLISLMDNWDSFKNNVNIATNSEGALQEQADIYAQSWEGARKRVKAATEGLFDTLINDEFFIKMTDGFADLIEVIDKIAKAFGGLSGILSAVSALMMKMFSGTMASKINSVANSIKALSPTERRQRANLVADAEAHLQKMTTDASLPAEEREQIKLQQQYLEIQRRISEEDKKQLEIKLKKHEALVDEVELAKRAETEARNNTRRVSNRGESAEARRRRSEAGTSRQRYTEEEIRALVERRAERERRTPSESGQGYRRVTQRKLQEWENEYRSQTDNPNTRFEGVMRNRRKITAEKRAKEGLLGIDENNINWGNAPDISDNLTRLRGNSELYRGGFNWNIAALEEKFNRGQEILNTTKDKQGNIDKNKLSEEEKKELDDIEQAIKDILKKMDASDSTLEERQSNAERRLIDEGFATQDDFDAAEQEGQAATERLLAEKNAAQHGKFLKEDLDNAKRATEDLGASITNVSMGVASVTSAVTSFMSLKDVWDPENEASGWEKLGSTLTTVGFALPQLITGFVSLGKGISSLGALLSANPVFIAIAAGILAVGSALAMIYDWTERYNIAVDKANKRLEDTQKTVKETTNAYNDLKGSLQGLQSSQETLAGLRKGTVEWKEQVIALNQEVLNLIAMYPQLAAGLKSVDGILTLDPEVVNQLLNDQLKLADFYSQSALTQQGDKAEAEQKRAEEQFYKRKITYDRVVNPYGYKNLTSSAIDGGQQKGSEEAVEQETISLDQLKDLFGQLQNSGYATKDENDKWDVDWTSFLERYEGNLAKTLDGNESLQRAITRELGNVAKAYEAGKQYDAEKEAAYQAAAKNTVDEMSNGQFSDTVSDAIAEGMQDKFEENKKEAKKEFESQYKTNDEIYARAEEVTGVSQESWKKQVEDGKTSVEDISNNLIDKEGWKKTYEEVTSDLEGLGLNTLASQYNGDSKEFYSSDDNIKEAQINDLKQGLYASGGSNSWLDTLTPEDIEILKNEILTDENFVNKIIEQNPDKFGENSVDNINSYLSSADFKENQEKSQQDRLNQNSLNTANTTISKGGLDTAEVEDYAEAIIESNKALEDYPQVAKAAAAQAMRMNKGLDELQESFEDNKKAITNNNKATPEYVKAMKNMKDSVSDVINAEAELSDDFIVEHMEDVEKAANGDVEAIERLKAAAAEEIVLKAVMDNNIGDNMKEKIDSLHNEISSYAANKNLNITPNIDDADFKNKCMEIIQSAQMTAETATDYFKQLGYDVEVEQETIDPEVTTKEYKYEDVLINGKKESWTGKEETITPKTVVRSIKSITYNGSSGGGISYSNTKAGGASTSKSGSGGSAKPTKKSSDEIERYHVENKQLEQIKNNLDEISKAKDKAFGKKRLDLLRDENKELNKQIDAQKTLLKEVEKNLSKDKGALAAYGAQFDKNGIVTNYEALYQQQINKFNNSARGEADEEAFNTFKEIFEQYEETLNLWQETKTALSDDIDKEFENRIETIQVELELKIDKAETNIEYIEYLLENLENKAFDAAEAISLLGENVENLLDKSNAYRQNIQDLLENEGVSKENIQKILNGQMSAEDMVNLGLSAETIEEIINSQKGLMETNRELLRSQKEIWENIGKVAEETIKGFDEQSEAISHASNVLEHYKNIVELVGQENLNVTDAMMNAAADANINNAMAALTNSKMQLETLQEQKAIIESNLTIKDLTESERELLKAQLEGINEEIRNAEDTMLSDWENVLKQASQEFDNAVSRTIKAFEKAMSGTFGSFERLQDAFNKQKELDDMYLDDYKKIYELSKLTRDIEKSIDSTDNIAGKQILLDLQKEINNLEAQGVKLSEYDVKNLRAKYDLRLAEIALEEAQNAKSQVRMTRDTEGNWSYVYTADENKMAEAQQNYEDKLYAMQELNAQYIENLESLIIQSHQKMTQEINSLDKAILGDRYDDEVQRITNFYLSQADIYNSQFNNALGNATDTYSFWEEYNIRTGYSISANEDWVNSFEETQLSILTGFETLEEYHQAFVDAVGSPDEEGSLLGGLASAYDDWSVRVNVAMEEIGTSTETFGEKFSQVVNNVNIKSDEAIEKSKELKDEYVSNMEDAVDAVEDFHNDTGRFIDEEIEKNNQLITSVRDLINAYRDLSYEDKNKNTTPLPNKEGTTYQNGANGGGDGGNYNGGGTVLNPATTLVKDSEEYKKGKEKGQSDSANNLPYSIPSEWANHVSYKQGYKDGYKISGGGRGLNSHMQQYDTGGYTGAWGTSGRLAVLHEKELVLNKQDTENILRSVDMVRHISTLIDARAAFNAANFSYAANIGHVERDISQNITINAEFPDATDRNEIQAAFENLFNRASQFANRKNKSWSN